MWNEEHEMKLEEFLTRSEKKTLIVYLEPRVENELQEGQDSMLPDRLIVKNEVPVTFGSLFVYFIKSYYSQEINNKESFHKYIQHGTFGGNHLRSLLRLCSGLYAPLFFDNKTWPDSELIYFIKF